MTPPTDPPYTDAPSTAALTFTVGAGLAGQLDPGVPVTVTFAAPTHATLALTDSSRNPRGPHPDQDSAYWHDGSTFLRPAGTPAQLLNRYARPYLLGEKRPDSADLSRYLSADLAHLRLLSGALYEQADEPVLEAHLDRAGPRLHVAYHALSRVTDRPGARFCLDQPGEARAWLRSQILTRPEAQQAELLRQAEALHVNVTLHRPDLLQYGQPRRYLVPVTVTYTAPLTVLAADGSSAYQQGQEWGDQYSQTRDPRGCAQVEQQSACALGTGGVPPCELKLPHLHLTLRDGALHVTQAGRTWTGQAGPLHISGPTLLAAGALLFLNPDGPEDLRALLNLTPTAQHAVTAALGPHPQRLAHRAARGLINPDQHRALTTEILRAAHQPVPAPLPAIQSDRPVAVA